STGGGWTPRKTTPFQRFIAHSGGPITCSQNSSKTMQAVKSSSPPRRYAPKSFGQYVLVECLGKGGMAVGYRARRRGAAGFQKEVVIKTILPELVRDFRFLRLFNEEAKLSAQLLHTNIAQVHDFGFVAGTPFLEMEYLLGCDVKQLWDRLIE